MSEKAASALVFVLFAMACHTHARSFSYDPSYNGHSRWFTLSDGVAILLTPCIANPMSASEACVQGPNDPELSLSS